MARYAPRRLSLEELVRVLVTEHATMKQGLADAEVAAAARDYETVGRILRELDPVFRQHIADEESSILGLLVRKLGAEGARKEISVFRQHRPIYALMLKVGELAGATSAELEGKEAELEELFSEHTRLEEAEVFPRSASLVRQRGP